MGNATFWRNQTARSFWGVREWWAGGLVLRIGDTGSVAPRHAKPRPVGRSRPQALVLPMVPVGDGDFLLAAFFTGFLAAFLTAFLTAFLAGFLVGMRDSPL